MGLQFLKEFDGRGGIEVHHGSGKAGYLLDVCCIAIYQIVPRVQGSAAVLSMAPCVEALSVESLVRMYKEPGEEPLLQQGVVGSWYTTYPHSGQEKDYWFCLG